MVRPEGARRVRRPVKHYSLDMILAVGYRIRSDRGTVFRQWATARLKEYLVKGFVTDDETAAARRLRVVEQDLAVTGAVASVGEGQGITGTMFIDEGSIGGGEATRLAEPDLDASGSSSDVYPTE